MRMVDIIEKKRDGKILLKEEIQFFITEFNKGNVPEYQASALLMAIYLNEMNSEETTALALAMAHSGEYIHYEGMEGTLVDKHSSGGVGDKTTLVLMPMVAALGLKVPKMSGRGLGFSGGTIDKLESISGFRTELSEEEFISLVNQNGVAIMGQTKNIAPVDKKLYALRDVTGTVENLSLIASSIMSKKLATATNAIVLDVKVGGGAFMKNTSQAIALAQTMQRIGQEAGVETIAAVTNMDEPLGFAIGNALEVKEVIETLRGNGPADLKELCLLLGSHMLVLGGIFTDTTQASVALEEALRSGKAYQKFADMIKAQGGDVSQIETPSTLPTATYQLPVYAKMAGMITEIDAEIIGQTSLLVGAGRDTVEDTPDSAAGIMLAKKVGDMVEAGELLCTIHSNDEGKAQRAVEKVATAYHISPKTDINKSPKNPMLFAIVSKEGTIIYKDTSTDTLIEQAWHLLEKSYSPYSGFQVGAVLQTKSGRLYTGVNIENSAYSPTNCAERTAFFKAISEGEQEFSAIIIVGEKADGSSLEEGYTTPCGVCRQVMMEFCDPNTFQIILANRKGEHKSYLLKELLPEGFKL